ncbi:MAG: OmpA family protein [Crocinitomicaceae bacterium]
MINPKHTIFILFLLTCTSSSAQIDTSFVRRDSSFIYPREIRFIGSSTEIDGNYKYVMEDLVTFLRTYDDFHIHIRGHVCCGPAESVSKKRAKSIYRFLLASGIPKERMSFKGYSDEIPAVWPEKTEEDAEANRRADFVICPPKKK